MCILQFFKKEQTSSPFLQSKPALLLEFPISVSGTILRPAVQARRSCPWHYLLLSPTHRVIQQTHMDPQAPCCWVSLQTPLSPSRPPRLCFRTPLSPRSPQQSPSRSSCSWSCSCLISSPLCSKSALSLKSGHL